MNIMDETEFELKKLYEQIQDELRADNSKNPEIEELLNLSFEELENEFILEQNTKTVQVKKLNPDAIFPKYAYELDSGFDLFSMEQVTLPPLSRTLIPTGLSFNIPEGFEIQVRSKSGLAINLGLIVLNSPGTVDRGYTGEIKVPMFNTNSESVIIEKGMKVGQAVLCPVVCGKFVNFEEVKELNESERGNSGFGSTGIKN